MSCFQPLCQALQTCPWQAVLRVPSPPALAAGKALSVSLAALHLPVGQAGRKGRKARPGAPWPGPLLPGWKQVWPHLPTGNGANPAASHSPSLTRPTKFLFRILPLVRGSPSHPQSLPCCSSIFLRFGVPGALLQPQHAPCLAQSEAALGCRPAAPVAPCSGKLAEGAVLPSCLWASEGAPRTDSQRPRGAPPSVAALLPEVRGHREARGTGVHVQAPIPGPLGVAQSVVSKRSKQWVLRPQEGLSMQDAKQHGCGNVLSGRTNIHQRCPCFQGCVESEEPEAHWPYLLKRPVFINWWSGPSPNRIPPQSTSVTS